MAASVGATGWAGRAYSAPPETGTLTTVQPSTWASGQAYVVDPTSGGINKVVDNNDGTNRLYQCRASHTSSSGNRPSGTSNTTQWAYLGLAPAANDTVVGSQVISVSLGRHTGAGGPLATPTDNDSGSFTLIRRESYASFTDWAIGVFRRSAAANTKTGYTQSVTWAGTSSGSGAGEEAAVGLLELRNVIVGAPVIDVHVERASPTGGTVTGANYTLTTRCLVVSIWGGNGNALSTGDLHTATPQSPLAFLGNVSSIVSLTNNGYFQGAVAWAIRNPGTYADVWTSGEGAQLFTLAWPVSELEGTGLVTLGTATSSAAGTVAVQGAADVTLGAATLAASGASPNQGALAATLGDATLSAAGTVPVVGAAAVTLDAATASGVGVVPVIGAAAVALGAAIAAATGTVPIVGAGAVALGDASLSAAGAVAVIGSAAIALDAATVSGAGAVAVQGAAGVTLGAATVAGAGAVAIAGAGGGTLEAATLSAVGVLDDGIAGSLTATLGAASAAGTGTVAIAGSLTATLDSATLSATGELGAVDDNTGTLAVTLGAAAASGSGVVPIVGAAVVTLGAATLSASEVPEDPLTLVENAIYTWIATASGLTEGQVIWGRNSAKNGPMPSGTFISMRLKDDASTCSPWMTSAEVSGEIVHKVTQPSVWQLEVTCFHADPFGSQRAQAIIRRVLASVRLPSVRAALREGNVGVGTMGRIRLVDGTRSGMLDPRAIVEVGLHIMTDIEEAGSAIERVEVEDEITGGTVVVEKP